MISFGRGFQLPVPTAKPGELQRKLMPNRVAAPTKYIYHCRRKQINSASADGVDMPPAVECTQTIIGKRMGIVLITGSGGLIGGEAADM